MRFIGTRLPLFPPILAFTFVLAAFFDADVSPHAAFRAVLVVTVAAVALTVLLTALLGPVRGGVAAGMVVLIARSGTLLHAGVALLLAGLVFAAVLLLRRMRPDSEALKAPIGVLNALSGFLLLATLLSAAAGGALARFDLQQGQAPEALQPRTGSASAQDPDVYVILLDGFPRADTAARLFGHDEALFLDRLGAMGFDVAEGASSNYMYTELTFTSMLHMRYVDEITDLEPVQVPYGVSLRGAINRNPVWDAFRAHGYTIAAAKPPWESEAMRSADIFCGDATNDFELFLVRTTLVGSALRAAVPSFEGDQHRAAVKEAFDCLHRLDQPTAGPKLVFIHVGSPHLPIVFGGDGSAADAILYSDTRQELPISDEAFADAYGAQLEYLERRTLEEVSRLLDRPDDPVVIILSDHGSESRLDWADATRSDMAERFGILFAAHTLGHPGLFDCDVTPIEVYPTILRTYLGEPISSPERRHFLSPTDAKLDVSEVDDPDGNAAC